MAQLIWPGRGGCTLFRGSFTVRCQVLESGFVQQFPGATLTAGHDFIPHAGCLLTPLTLHVESLRKGNAGSRVSTVIISRSSAQLSLSIKKRSFIGYLLSFLFYSAAVLRCTTGISSSGDKHSRFILSISMLSNFT